MSVNLPRHVAIIMDGNGRWAAARKLPRHAGHQAGISALRACVQTCTARGIGALTVFAFSSENWSRPAEEVSLLMGLFVDALDQEVDALHGNGVRLRFIGDRQRLSVRLQAYLAAAEARTAANGRLSLNIAMSYGGRWDITGAVRQVAAKCAAGSLRAADITEEQVAAALALADLPDPDLFIRTGGEHRISNFLLWNLAYTELYFTDCLWPDFDAGELDAALTFFGARERRYGRTPEQARSPTSA
ncbi:MAG TPA: polyprenyl diphosphate synthase [Steroidobacteraceae bacterium]|jgi:undecaprenyl diphosphate synthase|nr:polyprenyl diphosphate synthase [Steroidobacteraceae bacterium]